MTTDDTATTIRPGRDTALRWVKQMQPVRVLDGVTGRTTMDEGWVIGYFDEPSIAVLRRDGTIEHWSTHLPWQTTGEPPSPEERAALLSRRDQPAVTAEVWAAENARLRSQLAEARQQRDQAAEALVRAETERDDALQERDRWQQLADERAQNLHATLRRAFAAEDVALAARREAEALKTERDEARAEIARLERAAHEQGADLWIAEDRLDRLRRQVLAVAEDLERYASDPRPARLPMSERKLAWTLRQIVAEERPEAPKTGPTAPQTDEQAQVRGESHTEPQTGADGPWSGAWCRTQLQRLSIAASEQYGLRWRDYDVVGAVIAEIDRLRAALGSQGGSR